jgi:two-component system response regulator PhoP
LENTASDCTILMMERVVALGLRMKQILEHDRICVYSADTEGKLFTAIYEFNDTLALILLDLDIEDSQALELLKETKKRVNNTPIIVLTSGKPKGFFIEAMLSGAADFILKPFTDALFLSKIDKYLKPASTQGIEMVTLDLNRYLSGELRKAEKGSFPLTLMFLAFLKGSEDETLAEDKAAAAVSGKVFDGIRDLFWDTDIFICFASKYYLGVFPFCDEKNTAIISAKINRRFMELQKSNAILKSYRIAISFSSYPFDSRETGKIQEILINRVRETIKGVSLDLAI